MEDGGKITDLEERPEMNRHEHPAQPPHRGTGNKQPARDARSGVALHEPVTSHAGLGAGSASPWKALAKMPKGGGIGAGVDLKSDATFIEIPLVNAPMKGK